MTETAETTTTLTAARRTLDRAEAVLESVLDYLDDSADGRFDNERSLSRTDAEQRLAIAIREVLG